MFSIVSKSIGKSVLQARVVLPAGTRRSIIIMTNDNMSETDFETVIDEFADEAEEMGSDQYPGFRKEHLRGKERRTMLVDGRIGRNAYKKVRGLSDFIEFKRAMKMT